MKQEPIAVIFDFDGLLVDTENAEYLAWNWLFEEQGSALSVDVWKEAVGYNGRVDPRALLEKAIGKSLNWELLDSKRHQYYMSLVETLPSLPGAEMLMQTCFDRGLKVGIASNSSSEWVKNGLARVGLSRYVHVMATRDEVQHSKPHPDVYHLALSKLDADAAGTVAFEDSEPGVRAATAAGITVVAVPTRFTRLQDLSPAKLQVKSLNEISWEVLTALIAGN